MYLLQHFRLMVSLLHGRGWIVSSIDKHSDTETLVRRLQKEAQSSAQAERTAAFLAYQKIRGKLYVFPTANSYFDAATAISFPG